MYYLPFYFLAVKGFPAIQSGVSFIAMALPQLVGIVVSGALISKLGVYVSEFSGLTYLTPAQVPVIIIGQIIAAVGAGLLIMLVLAQVRSTVAWAAFLVILGLGPGIGINAPHLAIQAVFDEYVVQSPRLIPNSEGDVSVANGQDSYS